MKLFNKDDIVQILYEGQLLLAQICSKAGSRYLVRLIKHPTIVTACREIDMVLFKHGDK